MAKTYRTLDDLLIDCTARVQTQGGHGTGFFVAPGLILTCAHVILDAFQKNTPITVHYGGNVFPVEPISQKNVFSAPYPDLALLRVDIPDHPCVLLGTEYRAFTNFYSYGFTKDHPDGESTTVECEGTQEDAGTLIKLKEGQVKPGSSGSPLLNINNGTVCGLMKLTRDRSSDLGGAGIPMITVFASFPEIEGQNLAFHQHDSRWTSLLEKEQEIKGSNSVVALLYTEPGKIAQPRYFVGRAEILAQVNSLLDQSCRVLLTGMAGIGKTALAQVLADQRLQEGKGEVLWIEVKYEKADAILEALADRFADDQISKLKHIDEKIPALKALLERSKVGLVVLENVHNVSAADKIVGAVPDKVPVLITSRQRFAVDQIVEVDVLSLGDALKILERTSGTKDLSNNSDAIFLCEQLGYHPYALELAGSMMRELDRTPKELRRRLADAPLDLSSSTRGRLRALLDDSAANLDASTRAVLFSFGVFPSNGATSNLLAAYLNKTVEDISNALDELVRRNLIKRRPETEFYFMHDLTYYYVRSQAKPDSEEDIRILVDGSLRYVVAHRRDFDVLGLDLPNLLAVAGSIHDVDLVKLVSYLTIGDYPLQEGKSYADQRGYTIGLIEQLDRAIEAAQSLGEECSPTTHYLLGKRGNAAFRRGHYQLAAEKYEEELRLSPNDKRKAITESILARTLAFSGRREDARQAFEAAHQIAEKLKDDELLDFVLEQESRAAGQLKDHATALVVAEKQLVLSEALYKSDEKNYERLANALINLGSAKLYLAKEIRGDASEALIAYERAIHLAEKHHDDYLLADAFSSLGEYYHYVGEHDRAQSNFGRALKILSSLELIKDAEDLKLLMQENGYDIPNLEGEAK